MEKGGLNGIVLTKTTPIDLKNVTQFSVLNYSNQEVILTVKDIPIPIPRSTTVFGTTVPSLPFEMDYSGLPHDVELLIDFPVVKGGDKVIIFYTTKVNCK